jgi:hypothetical protein
MQKHCTQAVATKMKKNILLLIIATAGLFSCKQRSKSTTNIVDIETYNSVRNYKYADSMGNRLIIHNSTPKGGMKYTGPNGEVYGYVVFWTQITNETINPVELKIEFPLDSFEFPSSSGRYQRLLLPSDTMTIDKASLSVYGLNVNFFLDNYRYKPPLLKRTINPGDSTAFYVVIISKWHPIAGGSGSMRTGLRLKGQNLIYKISAYKMTHELPLMGEKEINCGSINLKNLMLQK